MYQMVRKFLIVCILERGFPPLPHPSARRRRLSFGPAATPFSKQNVEGSGRQKFGNLETEAAWKMAEMEPRYGTRMWLTIVVELPDPSLDQ